MEKLSAPQKKLLVQKANQVRRMAYVPYSQFPVGAAILTKTGKVFTGANIDNASYPATVCAECVAVYKAVIEGERDFIAIAVVSPSGGSPCGICRQVLSEFGTQLNIIIADKDGVIVKEIGLDELLPDSFGPGDLKKG